MSKREYDIARVAALQVVSSLRETVQGLVDYNLQRDQANVPQTHGTPALRPSRWSRVYIDEDPKPIYDPAAGFGQCLSEMAKWLAGRGDMISVAWMFKPTSAIKLMIQQYGVEEPECAILQLDRSQPKTKIFNGDVVSLGKSPWTGFASRPGTLAQVVEKHKMKGWYLQPTPQSSVQLNLVEPVQMGSS